MALDLSSLRKATEALDRAVSVAATYADSMSADVAEVIRAGVIQNFEVAYEQCWKFMQRWLRENQSPAEADFPRTRKDLFRAAARYGLISDPEVWFTYGDMRNLTTHTYNEQEAAAVLQSAKQFVVDAKALLERLESLRD